MPGTAAGAPLRSAGRAFVVPGRAAGRVPSRHAAAADAACRHLHHLQVDRLYY